MTKGLTVSTPSPNGPTFGPGDSLFSGIVCFGFKTLKAALDGQRYLIELDVSDKITDIELERGVRDVPLSLQPGISDEWVSVETFFAVATVEKAGLIMMDNRVSQLKGYAGIFYVISTDPRHTVRSTITQKAHRAAAAYETPDGIRVWTETKNRWGPSDLAKYTLEEIKRIYRAYVVGQEHASP